MFSKINQFLRKLSGSSSGTKNKLEQQVQLLLAEAKIPEAMELLLENGYSSVTPLKVQWQTAHRQFAEKLIDAQIFNVTINRITYALLSIVNGDEQLTADSPQEKSSEPASTLSSSLTKDQMHQIRELLAKNQWKEALELSKDWSWDVQLLYQRYQRVIRDNNLGLVTQHDFNLILRQISESLVQLVSPEKQG